MRLIIGGESGWGWLERASYHGAIGFFYNDTLGGVLSYAIATLLCVFAIIGIITVFKGLFFRPKKSKLDKEKDWIKTGKW